MEVLGRLMTLSLGERGASYTDKDTTSFGCVYVRVCVCVCVCICVRVCVCV